MDERPSTFEPFLRGQALLVALLGAALALFLRTPALQTAWRLPELKLALGTVFALAGGLIASLTATRLAVEARRYDLLLCGGTLLTGAAWLCFAVVPQIAGAGGDRTDLWAAVAGRVAGWAAIAAAPFAHGRVRRRRHAPAIAGGAVVAALVAV